MRDVFILGAGFSRAINPVMPTTNMLAQSMAAELSRDPRFSNWVDVDGNLPDADVERWMSRLAERHPYDDAVSYQYHQATFAAVSRIIASSIRTAQSTALDGPGPFDWLAGLVKTWDATRATVITFNYDTLVETTYLTQLGAEGFLLSAVLLPPGGVRPYTAIWGQPGSAESFALCKLHGTINWFWQPDGFDRSVIDIGIDDRWPSPVPPSSTGDPPLAERAGSREPFIVPPTSLKGPFFQHDTLRHHWTYAQKKLAEAERVWIVGYSLPLTDLVAGSLISTLSGSHPEITVVDCDAQPVAERVRGLISGSQVNEVAGENAVETFAQSYAEENRSLNAEARLPAPGASTRVVPVPHTPETVVSLRIALPGGGKPERPFPLQEGENPFVCYATYIDGSEHPFDAYWTCPLFERSGGVQLWSVFGKQRRPGVTVSASERHERYHELVCWARLPEPTSNDIPRDGIAFDYSSFASS